jgi:hypothetical protein
MIDFRNGSFFKLALCDEKIVKDDIDKILIENEIVIESFKAIRDYVVFTDKRIISVNVQGVTGKKRDYTSLPYNKIQVFSVETAGTFDLDCELELYFSGLGKVKFDITGKYNITKLSKLIGSFVLK